MRLALDTNRYTDLMRGDRRVASVLESAEAVYLPFVVMGELKAGFQVGSKAAENETQLSRFLLKPGVSVLLADRTTVEVWAELQAHLHRHGRPIPHNDVWLAALCVQHGLTLYTRDQHFDHLPQVVRV